MTRSWSERGKWMDEHQAAIARHGEGYLVAYLLRPNDQTGHRGPEHGWATAAVDAAMGECARLEREAAEQAKRAEAAKDRSPIAALAERWKECPTTPHSGYCCNHGFDLRAAITAQADRWRERATGYVTEPLGCRPDWFFVRDVIALCADELEGKA